MLTFNEVHILIMQQWIFCVIFCRSLIRSWSVIGCQKQTRS